MESSGYIKFNDYREVLKALPTDKDLKDYLAYIRWGDKPKCIYCGHDNVWQIKTVPGRYECPMCKKDKTTKNHTFSVLQGTIFEGTRVPIDIWFWNMFEFCLGASSSLKSAERHNISSKTAWRINMFLREVVKDEQERILTAGEIEIDEVILDSEPWKDLSRYTAKAAGEIGYHTKIKAFGIRERGSGIKASKKKNTPAVAGGYVVIIVVDDRTAKTLMPILKKHVPNKETVVFHDAATQYSSMKKHYPNSKEINKSLYKLFDWRKHCRWIDNDTGELVEWNRISKNDNVTMLTVNSVENSWSHLTRDFHEHFGFSRLHAQRYMNEFMFRHNRRHLSQADKFHELLIKCLNTPRTENLHLYELQEVKGRKKKVRIPK